MITPLDRRHTAALIALLLISGLNSWAGKNKREQAKELFEAAEAATDLHAQPYQLRARVKLQLQTMVEGDLIVDWNPPDQRRTETRLPGYAEIPVLNGAQEWISRPTSITPLRVRDAQSLLTHTMFSPNLEIKSIKNVVRERHDLVCVSSQLLNLKYEDCFDTHQHVRWSNELRTGNVVRLTEYGDYRQVGEKLLPGLKKVSENGSIVAEIRLEDLVARAAPAQTFAPLQGVQPRTSCASKKPPKALHTPDPEYTPDAKKGGIQGTVVLGVVVGSDGKVEEAAVARTLEPGLDEQALKAVRKWRFEPARCDSTPVITEINVEVNFRLY